MSSENNLYNNVCEAIKIICNNQEQFDEANQYLMEFRKSPEQDVWSISIQLLNEKEDQYVFQGLSILEEKIQLDFHTLSPELANSLGDILLGKCSEFLGRTYPVRSLLSYCLALFFVQYQNIQSINCFDQLYNPSHVFYYIYSLRNIMEILDSNRNISVDKLKAKRLLVQRDSDGVFGKLTNLLKEPNMSDSIKSELYECLSKWIRPGYTSPTIIVESGFIQHILSIDRFSTFYNKSTDCLVSIVNVLSRCQGYQSVIQSVADKVIQDYQHVDQLEEESAHLLVEIGKSLLNLENPFTDIYSNFYTTLLQLFSSPDEQYRHILINFVERLFYRLNELNIDSNNIENWKNMALYGCILLAERPYNMNQLSKEKRKQINNDRDYASDCLESIYEYINGDEYSKYIFSYIQSIMEGVINGTQPPSALEVGLFALNIMSDDDADLFYSSELEEIFVHLLEYPKDIYLGKTFLNIIKKGCEYWDGDSDILQISIPFVIQCITDMNLEKAGEVLSEMFKCFYNRFASTAGGQYMLNFISTNVCNCPHNYQEHIRKGVHDALRANQDSELFQCVVNNTQQIVQRLSDLYQSQCEDMSQFYALFKSLPFFTFVMPSCEIPYQIYGCNYRLFFSILERFDYCTNLNEQFCTYIKHLMRINPEKFKIFLNDLIKMINSIFNHHLDSSCLYLLKSISVLYYRELKEIGIEQELVYVLQNMISILSNPGYVITNEEEISDIFCFIFQVLTTHLESMIMDENNLNSLINIAMRYSAVRTTESYIYICDFFNGVLSVSTLKNDVVKSKLAEILSKNNNLVNVLVDCLFNKLPMDLVNYYECNYIDVLWRLKSDWPSFYNAQINMAIQNLSIEAFNDEEKQELIAKMNNSTYKSEYENILYESIRTARKRQRFLC